MASGGRSSKAFSLSKLPQSEPKQSRGWQKASANSDDQNETEQVNSSQKNLHKEVRINNWGFADWRPQSASTDSKRRKKSKGNPEREREQSLSLDSPPQRDKKPRTPSTFPRTKIGPTTPTAQKRALENLRSRMTFSETDEGSTDGEPNNERAVLSQRKQPPNYTRQDTSSTLDGASQLALPNRNNNREDVLSDLDSNQIVGRLMQIRDYIKQANTMRDTLNKSKETQANTDDMDKLRKLVDNLKEQERGYMGLLQRMLALRDAGIIENGNGFLHSTLFNDDDEDDNDDIKTQSDDTVSVDLEVQTNASDTTTEERTNSSSSRPFIEDKLGDTDEEEEGALEGRRSKESASMDNTLVAHRNTQSAEWDFGIDTLQTEEVPSSNQLDAMRTNELAALQQQQNLLKILADKQEQLRALQGRQDALMAMHKEAETKLVAAQNKENKAKSSVMKATEAVRRANNSQSAGDENGEAEAITSATTTTTSQLEQLMAMRNRLELLKNASADIEQEAELQDLPDNQPVADDSPGRQHLQHKLEDLQSKKEKMDGLLKELQTLRSQRFETLLQGEEEAGATAAPLSTTSSQVKFMESLDTMDQVDATADSAEHVLSMMDAQNKHEKLQEVKERLDQLRGLVQYYQGANKSEIDGAEGVDQSSVPGYSDYGEGESSENAQRHPVSVEKIFQSALSQQNLLNPLGGMTESRRTDRRLDMESQQSDEDNASNNDSQMSSLGPWGDEPEIREKVRQLKATKEKLQQLQDLVAMVQQSPEVAQSLPDNIRQLVDSTGEDREQHTSDTACARNISLSETEVPTRDITSDQVSLVGAESILTVKDQIKELSVLKQERERLLAIQNQLKSLHENFDEEEQEDEAEERDEETELKKRSQSEPGPVVTFASNDELYSKMRKQRMLREELRSKKKELEAIMKKDRNKRQYFKNQDNQSDTVSYSTDAFGASASADATMATWGGSTVDNLENITETHDGRDEEEDGYLSDGIVQVEEEEEENDSDNHTYTIEADARHRRAARTKPSSTPDVRPKTRKTASFPRALPTKESGGGQRVKPQKKLVVRKTRLQRRSKQENYRSAEEIVRDVETADSSRLDTIQQQLERTLELLQNQQPNMLQSPNTSGITNAGRPGMYPTDLLQQQMYQQQMMMSINQCFQQLNMQQLEMRNLQTNVQQISHYVTEPHHHQQHGDNTDLTPLASSSAIPISPNFPPTSAPRPSSFSLNPQFPPSFSQLDAPSTTQESSVRSPARQDTSRNNNLRPVPIHRTYQQNLNNYSVRDKDVRPKVAANNYSKQKRGKESHVTSPREGLERSMRENRRREGANNSVYSEPSVTGALSSRLPRNREGEASELSLFETLRETIYSEVATLISQNESRPHFLIELFRELQNLSSDYLRQRGLYAVQELVTKTLSTEEDPYAVASRWTKRDTENLTASDATPSESCITSDDDEVRELMEKKKKLQHQGLLKNNEYDYTEQVENTSSLSTPSTGLMESPFANESLGDTVIHLDKALERMRQMERKESEEGRMNPQSLEIVYNRVREARQAARLGDQQQTSSSLDQASDNSVPELLYSKLNSKHLDDQVKQIITEVIPVVKEHIDDVCSPQLLAYIKRLVLSLTRQNDSRQEFTSFFHRQLGSILHDSLARFEGRKVRECGDDLLYDMSDALYDELAFFRMMQDLNHSVPNTKLSSATSTIKTSSPDRSPLHRPIFTQPVTNGNITSEDEDLRNLSVTGAEEENLGKERDDELAAETVIQDGDDKDQDTESPYKSSGVKIELAVSETKPFTRIGSDEDDEDSDESHSAEDPSETAVSRDAKMSQSENEVSREEEHSSPSQPQATKQSSPSKSRNGEPASPSKSKNAGPTSPSKSRNGQPTSPSKSGERKEEKNGDGQSEKAGGADNTQNHLVNGEREGDDISVEDLPAALNIPCSKDLNENLKEEDEKTSVETGILSMLNTPVELVGDGNNLPNPDNFGK